VCQEHFDKHGKFDVYKSTCGAEQCILIFKKMVSEKISKTKAQVKKVI
jgi:hypothetical protein